MNTIRVDICYRPLRVGWAVEAGDIEAFKQAVRFSHALWGGRFNPILVVDDNAAKNRAVDLFRIDLVIPVGNSETVREFPSRFPHLITPFFGHSPFVNDQRDGAFSQILDVHNALVYLQDTPDWNHTKEKGFLIHNWSSDDPLANVFEIELGRYPDVDEVGIDYLELFSAATEAKDFQIDVDEPISEEVLNHPSIPYLSRHHLSPYYRGHRSRSSPGFFVGDAANFDDLVRYWNLRACDIQLLFIDHDHQERFSQRTPEWRSLILNSLSERPEGMDSLAIWTSDQNIEEARKLFCDTQFTWHQMPSDAGDELDVLPPVMHFSEVSALGVVGNKYGDPGVSFPLSEKPFCGETWFHTQRLVASISFLGGPIEDESHVLVPTFVPELNEFFARTMFIKHDSLRIEPESAGLIIDAADKDIHISALPVAKLMSGDSTLDCPLRMNLPPSVVGSERHSSSTNSTSSRHR
jgi:hypothetical protein